MARLSQSTSRSEEYSPKSVSSLLNLDRKWWGGKRGGRGKKRSLPINGRSFSRAGPFCPISLKACLADNGCWRPLPPWLPPPSPYLRRLASRRLLSLTTAPFVCNNHLSCERTNVHYSLPPSFDSCLFPFIIALNSPQELPHIALFVTLSRLPSLLWWNSVVPSPKR